MTVSFLFESEIIENFFVNKIFLRSVTSLKGNYYENFVENMQKNYT